MTPGPSIWKPSLDEVVFLGDESIFVAGASPSNPSLLPLPIAKHRRQILYSVEHFSVVVVVGTTGSGKSTQIPQYLAQAGWASNGFSVVCTQPRRMAAISLAQRVAHDVGVTAAHIVGHTVRFDDSSSPHTKIKYVTDGILLQQAITDPLLSNYSVVMVDEAHERTLNTDALLGLLHKIRRKRPDLRLIICSATINAIAFLDFFVGKGAAMDDTPNKPWNKTATIISVDGRQFPVDVYYLQAPTPDYLIATVETVWNIHNKQAAPVTTSDCGDIMCFLPTAEDIDRAIRLAEDYFDQKSAGTPGLEVDFLPLHGTLPFHLQSRIFEQSQPSQIETAGDGTRAGRRRRIIFATNIAETSVTVPRIRYVVDSGLVKLPYFDPVTGLERLLTGTISQASAQQRSGRSGRICAGACYRLYTERYLTDTMPAQTPPEILRTNLTSFILTLKVVGVDNILAFDLIDIPSVDALQHGLESLYALGAIDDMTRITDAGLDMATFSVEPRVARMLLESFSEGCSWEVLAVASALQVRDLLHKPRYSSGSSQRQQQMLDYEEAMSDIVDTSGDHVTYSNLFADADDRGLNEAECKEKFVNYFALKRGMEVRSQLARSLRMFGRVQAFGLAGDASSRSQAIRRCVTAGFFFNIAKLGSDGRYYTIRKNILVSVASSSVLTTHSQVSSEYIVFGETTDGVRGGIELKSVSAVAAKWLREIAPHYWE